jgi:hypothetical protein
MDCSGASTVFSLLALALISQAREECLSHQRDGHIHFVTLPSLSKGRECHVRNTDNPSLTNGTMALFRFGLSVIKLVRHQHILAAEKQASSAQEKSGSAQN